MTYTEIDLVAAIEHLAGRNLASLTQPERDQLDQFHSGGTEAVDRLLTGLDLEPGMTVLDVGSGLGGPARQIARASGARVIGVDLAPAYVEVARAITSAAGQGAQVTFVCGDLGDLGDLGTLDRADFDAAVTMHVQMNVADKRAFFTEIAGHLRPGARLAIFEVCRTETGQPSLPLPWSLDGHDSHLVTAAELRDTVRVSGFDLVEWTDETSWISDWFAQAQPMGGVARGATLAALLDDGPSRMRNFRSGLAGGLLSVNRGIFIRAGIDAANDQKAAR